MRNITLINGTIIKTTMKNVFYTFFGVDKAVNLTTDEIYNAIEGAIFDKNISTDIISIGPDLETNYDVFCFLIETDDISENTTQKIKSWQKHFVASLKMGDILLEGTKCRSYSPASLENKYDRGNLPTWEEYYSCFPDNEDDVDFSIYTSIEEVPEHFLSEYEMKLIENIKKRETECRGVAERKYRSIIEAAKVEYEAEISNISEEVLENIKNVKAIIDDERKRRAEIAAEKARKEKKEKEDAAIKAAYEKMSKSLTIEGMKTLLKMMGKNI